MTSLRLAFAAAVFALPAHAGFAADAKPDPLVIYFNSGSTAVSAEGSSVLDHASRLYRDGKPIVMIISGSTDAVGSPNSNLILSQKRDQAVLRGLIGRGIPADRFQLLAKGQTEPAVPGHEGEPEAQNRRVEITWR